MAQKTTRNEKAKSKQPTKAAKQTANKPKRDLKNEVWGVCAIALGILLLISLLVNTESFLKTYIADGFMRGSFGLGAYLIPILFMLLGVLAIMYKKPDLHPGKIAMTTLMILALCGLVHIIFSWFGDVGTAGSAASYREGIAQAYEAGIIHKGMGGFAALYVYPLSKLVSNIGALVVFAALILISWIVLFNLSLHDAGAKVTKKVRETEEKVRQSMTEASIRRAEKKKNYDYDLNDGQETEKKAEKTVRQPEKEPEKEPEDKQKNVRRFTIIDTRSGTTTVQDLPVNEKEETTEEKENDFGEQGTEAVVPERHTTPVITDYPGARTPKETEALNKLLAAAEADREEEAEQNDTADEFAVEEGPTVPVKPEEPVRAYQKPPLNLMNLPPADQGTGNTDHTEKIEMMESTLKSFGINAWVENITVGPAITRYEMSIERGTRVSKILNLSDDIALSMAAVGVRIEAPIPGKSAIGIEIPNDKVSMVTLREVLESEAFQKHKSPVAVGLGKDITGAAIIADLSKMPHLLIAGQTGSGKSVCINSIITSLIYKASPKEVKMILVDPKKVELNVYNGLPHLMTPVVSDPKKAAGALQFVVREMEKRYETFAKKKVKEIVRYNEVALENGEEIMPRIVVIVDELNDLMLVARGEVEDSVMRIAQLARAAGIYLILATQRPSVNVITGVIKANIPSRIAFAVASGVDSKTILDATGAEKLVGKGDMLFHLNGESKPSRVQGAFVGEQEIEKVVEFVKANNSETQYIDQAQFVMRELKPTHGGSGENPNEDNEDADGDDTLFPAAVEYAIECGSVSVSALQRKFRIGYARAGRLVDDMENRGIVEASQGSKARKVLMTREQFWAVYDERID